MLHILALPLYIQPIPFPLNIELVAFPPYAYILPEPRLELLFERFGGLNLLIRMVKFALDQDTRNVILAHQCAKPVNVVSVF